MSDTESEDASVYASFIESSDLITHRKVANKCKFKVCYLVNHNGLAHLLADDEMTNTLLPCSVGRADVRITNAGICAKAEKEALAKASAVRYEWLLLWEAEGC